MKIAIDWDVKHQTKQNFIHCLVLVHPRKTSPNMTEKLLSCRDISGTEYEWVVKMGQWAMSQSFTCKYQDIDGPFEILFGQLE